MRQKRFESVWERRTALYKSHEQQLGHIRVQELCESRGGRPGLSVLMSLKISVDVKQHWTMPRHWSQFVPNMSTRHPRTCSSTSPHEALLHHTKLYFTTWSSVSPHEALLHHMKLYFTTRRHDVIVAVAGCHARYSSVLNTTVIINWWRL